MATLTRMTVKVSIQVVFRHLLIYPPLIISRKQLNLGVFENILLFDATKELRIPHWVERKQGLNNYHFQNLILKIS